MPEKRRSRPSAAKSNGDLSFDDYRALLAGVASLYQIADQDEFARRALAVISGLVPCEVGHINEINVVEKRSVAVATLPDDPFVKHLDMFSRFAHQHPRLNYVAESGDGGPRTINDHLSLETWRKSDLNREFFTAETKNAEDQLSFLLPGSDAKSWMVGVALTRKWGGFRSRDRELVAIIYPHVHQAYLNARAVTRLRAELAASRTGLEASSTGLVSLDREGRIIFATPLAEKLMSAYFPASQRGVAPEAITRWFAGKTNTGEAWAPLRVGSVQGQLSVRATRHETGISLVLTERPAKPFDANALPHLSPRQTQVIALLAEGLSEKEVAARLEVTRTTVHGYITSLHRTLGVSSRGELLARYYRSLS